jgi:hypothetical protein
MQLTYDPRHNIAYRASEKVALRLWIGPCGLLTLASMMISLLSLVWRVMEERLWVS